MVQDAWADPVGEVFQNAFVVLAVAGQGCENVEVLAAWGAAASGGLCLLPSSTGADLISPERALIHSRQGGHQLPPCLAACSRQAGASAAFDAAVQKQVFGLPGGLIRL